MAAGLGFKTFTTGEVLTAANVNGYLMQGILVFASAAARDAAITSPQEGQACYLKDTNEVLTYSGSAWVAVGAGGGITLITETVASTLSSLSYTSLGSYKQLLLWWSGIQHSTTGSSFTIRFNADSTGGNYQVFGLDLMTGPAVGAPILGNQGAVYTGSANTPFGIDANGADTYKHVSGYLIVDNYTSATKFKNYRGHHGFQNTTTSNYTSGIYNGFYLSTSAITSIDITRLTGAATFSNIANSSIRLYGIS